MALIFNRRQRGVPGVHVVLIGVGTVPTAQAADLLGDDAPDGGFGDLETPLHSVEALSEWLQTQLNVADTPLQTIRVLASSSSRVSPLTATAPTFQSLANEIGDWADELDTHEDNLGIFYFCGHGLRIGAMQYLLAQDFGDNRRAPFENSIEPELLANAMRKNRARRQLFLIDACSSEAPFKEMYKDAVPRTLIQAAHNGNLARSEQCLIRASKFGTRAFGSTTGPSLFTEAFLRAMRGGGAMQAGGGRWVISTDMLKLALDSLIKLQPNGYGQEVSFGGGALSTNVAFHLLPGRPMVPVRVSCAPPDFEAVSDLYVNSTVHAPAGSWPGNFEMPRGSHSFEAVEPTPAGPTVHGQLLNEPIAPPFVDVYIPC